jgi:kynurenine formamidase
MVRTLPTLAAGLALTVSYAAAAQTWQPPPDSERCPSKWGADDQRGSGNHMGPASVLKAARLIETGQVFELGRVLQEQIPLVAGRRFEIFTKRTRYDAGTNRRSSNEELVVAEIGQVGTQFDTFSHQMIGDSLYNCASLTDVVSRTGFTKLGVEQVGALMTRAVLIDVAGLKGVPVLPDSYEITPQDLQEALRRQGVPLERGDAVLIHTGWGVHWGRDNVRYQATSPGIGVAAAEWLAGQDPMLVGADNGGVEVAPNPDRNLAGPVHQIMLVVNGIHLLENLRLDELAASGAHEFAFVIQPLKIQGGTGSTVAPIAIR